MVLDHFKSLQDAVSDILEAAREGARHPVKPCFTIETTWPFNRLIAAWRAIPLPDT